MKDLEILLVLLAAQCAELSRHCGESVSVNVSSPDLRVRFALTIGSKCYAAETMEDVMAALIGHCTVHLIPLPVHKSDFEAALLVTQRNFKASVCHPDMADQTQTSGGVRAA